MSKVDSTVDWAFLESCLREDLNEHAQRVMAVLRPVKLTITNYPEGQTETVTVENNPVDPTAGERQVPFSRHLYIEADDFMETPVPKYKRLVPGGLECRLKGAYLIRCTGCVKDENGQVVEVLCEYDPDSRGGNPADGRATANAAVTGVSVYDLLEAAGGVSSGANAITFVSSDGYEVTLPLSYVLQRASMIVYQLNGEPLSASVGGTNQLWLGSTSARYFASDVVEVRVTCEDEIPAIPGSPASGDHASNVPNVGVTAGASA